jgi:hypothetical protein
MLRLTKTFIGTGSLGNILPVRAVCHAPFGARNDASMGLAEVADKKDNFTQIAQITQIFLPA